MRSHLLSGKVRHKRTRPWTYELEHDVFYLALDLSELDLVSRSLRLFSRGRANLLSFRDADHWLPPATDLRSSVLEHLRDAGVDATEWQITLIATPRVLGYQFNPASFYLCRDEVGELRVVVVEVHNTHHERRLYTLRPEAGSPGFVRSFDKDFYVSPFIDMDARYTFRIVDEADRVRIAITETEHGEPLLVATLAAERRPLTDRALLGTLLRVPLATQKTILAIHLHALRMWRRGLTFHRHSEVTNDRSYPHHAADRSA
jgi:DUF1365 family protein